MFRLSDFTETDVPISAWVNESIVCDSSFDEYCFLIAGEDGLTIDLRGRPCNLSNHEIQLDDGKLVGTDYGEFIGALHFLPDMAPAEDAQEFEKLISYGSMRFYSGFAYRVFNGNIIKLFRFGRRIFALSGLAHLLSDEGILLEVLCQDNLYCANVLADLGSQPSLYNIVGRDLYILTNAKFYIFDTVSNNLKTELPLPYLFVNRLSGTTHSLSQTSMVVLDDKTIFVGFNGGIMKLNPTCGSVRLLHKKTDMLRQPYSLRCVIL